MSKTKEDRTGNFFDSLKEGSDMLLSDPKYLEAITPKITPAEYSQIDLEKYLLSKQLVQAIDFYAETLIAEIQEETGISEYEIEPKMIEELIDQDTAQQIRDEYPSEDFTSTVIDNVVYRYMQVQVTNAENYLMQAKELKRVLTDLHKNLQEHKESKPNIKILSKIDLEKEEEQLFSELEKSLKNCSVLGEFFRFDIEQSQTRVTLLQLTPILYPYIPVSKPKEHEVQASLCQALFHPSLDKIRTQHSQKIEQLGHIRTYYNLEDMIKESEDAMTQINNKREEEAKLFELIIGIVKGKSKLSSKPKARVRRKPKRSSKKQGESGNFSDDPVMDEILTDFLLNSE